MKCPIVQMLSWITQCDIVIQKYEYLQNHDLKNVDVVTKEDNTLYHRLGSPRDPKEFISIDDVEHKYNFHKLHLGVQSWVHNYLQGGIRKNGRLKRVKRSHLPKLSNVYMKIYNCITIQLVDYDMDDDGILKQIARCTTNWQKNIPHNDIVLVGNANSDGNGLDRFEIT